MGFALIILGAFMLGTSLYVFKKYPKARKLLPWLSWLAHTIQISIDHWGFKRSYKEGTKVITQLFVVAGIVAQKDESLRDSRKLMETLLSSAYSILHDKQGLTPAEQGVMMAAYVAAINHDEIMETLASVWKTHEDLDVRKATLLCVDILGEAMFLEDDLGQEYFQHLIYGLNKSLKLLRAEGLDKRNLKEITATLFRVYRLTKAYRHRRALSGMDSGEVYDKIISILEHMAYVVATK